MTQHYASNLLTERPTFVTHLECGMTGERVAADTLHNLSPSGKPLLVRYHGRFSASRLVGRLCGFRAFCRGLRIPRRSGKRDIYGRDGQDQTSPRRGQG